MSAGYKAAVRWIAENDETDIGDEHHGYILTILLVADLWQNGDADKVARDVMKVRAKIGL